MSQQLQITGGAKVRSLEGVITGSTGVLGSLPINASNGIPQLDVNGKILVSQLPNSVMEYKGTWNAATNTPTLADGTGNQGDVYLCNVAGTVNFGSGPISFVVGDQVIYSGTIWQRASGATGTVTSVAVTESGDALSITGSPITTSGTINIGFAGTSAQYVAGDGSLITFPSIASEAQNLITEVYNKTGATLTKGTIVYINGGQGNLPTVTKALATGDGTSAQTFGIVQNNITNMNNGYVVVAGRLSDLDTQAYTDGTQLYLSSTTAGAWTSTKQYAPAHLVYVGIVTRSHPTQGVVEVKIMNGFELDELHNVSAQSPSNNHGIFYNSTTLLWENKSIATALGYTPISLSSLSASAPLSYNNSTGAFTISQASGSTNGFLSSTDWNTFNSKQATLTNPITGTGVSGRIAYFNGTTTQTSSANLTWDATNNRLGIGLNNPQRSLEIYSATADSHLRLSGAAPSVSMGEAITGSVYQAKFGLATANGQYVAGAVAGDFVIISQTGSTIWANSGGERMRLNINGTFSIGNTNSTYNLDVTGTGRFTGALTGTSATFSALTNDNNQNASTWIIAKNQNAGSGAAAGFLMTNNTGDLGAISLLSSTNSPSNALFIRTLSTNSLILGANSAANLTIANGGAATFSSSVTAGSNINATNTSSTVSIIATGIGSGTNGGSSLIAGVSGITHIAIGNKSALLGGSYDATSTIYWGNGGNLVFNNGSDRMIMTSGGKVLIGTTTAGYGLFNEQRVTINPTNDGIVVAPLPQNNSAYTVQGSNDSGNRYAMYIANGSSSGVGSISFTSSSTSFNTSSDYRLKQDLKDYNALLLINNIKTYDFEWKSDKSRMYGVLAHELQDVIPYAVSGEKDGEQMQGVDYSKIVPVLVKAIQEQNQLIQELQSQINELKNK